MGAVSFARQAAHCRALMRQLGIERAHVVGHSSSASMALQLALDSPEAVQSLALLDAARPAPPSALHTEMVRTVVEPALERYRAGDNAGAVDIWMGGVCGPDYRVALEPAIPGAFEQAVRDADTFFGQELPAVLQWSFGREEAARVTQPVLAVLGRRAIPSSASDANCCSRGCRTSSRSSFPRPPTCSTCRTPARWQTPWPRSSPATGSQTGRRERALPPKAS